MPLYEYQCDQCGRQFELIRKFSDPPLDKCPHCGGTVHKLFSSPAIQFKGSGFYITDYAKKDQTSGDAKSDAAGKDKEKGETSAKGDATEKSDKTEKSAGTEKSNTDKSAKTSEKTTTSDKKPGRDDTTTTKTDSAPAAKAPAKEKD